MSFISLPFLFFLPMAIGLYYLMPKNYRWLWLCGVSLFFYGYWDIYYIPLLLASALLDYFCGQAMYRNSSKRVRSLWLFLSLFGNLSFLFFFKYWNFFGSNLNKIIDSHIEIHDLLLPIGLSFYTLQTLSYSFDIYRRKITPERHFGFYFLYVSFFPQLVAGPIERASKLLPQLKNLWIPSVCDIRKGLLLIFWGFFLKLVVADNMSTFIGSAYTEESGGVLLWGASILVMLKVYADFLAYSEIARGCALLLGVSLSFNFRQPFLAKNLHGFWRRWHITLTKWLVDYVQIPLLRRFPSEPWRSMMGIVTLCLIGFWHGASWNFILFGLTHGVAIALWRPVAKLLSFNIVPAIVKTVFSRVVMYAVIIMSAPMFYIQDVDVLLSVLDRMLTVNLSLMGFSSLLGLIDLVVAFFGLLFLLLHDWVSEKKEINSIELVSTMPFLRKATFLFLFASILMLGSFNSGQFVYFAF